MIWLAWRQRRGAIVATGAFVLGVAVILLLTGRQMDNALADGALGACLDRLGDQRFVPVDAGCIEEAEGFASRFFTLRLLGLAVFTPAPLIVGMFWGAPVIARELEHDTASLVWTQGVTRRRWASTELGLTALIVAVTMSALAASITWW